MPLIRVQEICYGTSKGGKTTLIAALINTDHVAHVWAYPNDVLEVGLRASLQLSTGVYVDVVGKPEDFLDA